jgi:hypothetical protein
VARVDVGQEAGVLQCQRHLAKDETNFQFSDKSNLLARPPWRG